MKIKLIANNVELIKNEKIEQKDRMENKTRVRATTVNNDSAWKNELLEKIRKLFNATIGQRAVGFCYKTEFCCFQANLQSANVWGICARTFGFEGPTSVTGSLKYDVAGCSFDTEDCTKRADSRTGSRHGGRRRTYYNIRLMQQYQRQLQRQLQRQQQQRSSRGRRDNCTLPP